MIPVIEVKGEGREYGLYVDGQLIGTSKLDCDARMQMYFLQKKFEDVSQEAYADGQRNEQEWRENI
jgi:hypothetical protein